MKIFRIIKIVDFYKVGRVKMRFSLIALFASFFICLYFSSASERQEDIDSNLTLMIMN